MPLEVNVKVWEGLGVNESEARRKLAQHIKSDRIEQYGTVEKARRAAEVSRGSWDAAEAGKPVKEFTLNRIAKALGWEMGEAQRALAGTPVASDFLEEIERADVSEATKEHARRLEAERLRRLREAQ